MTEKKSPRGLPIYLLPNLLTTAALFAGFYAIVAAMKGHFDVAAIGIFIAMLMDTFDGRVARLTNTASAFGAEYDSLSDMVAFGIAPSLVIYSWALHGLGKLGWLAAFFYTAATALRLARFNVQTDEVTDKRYFQGLPCPSAAGTLAGLIWIGHSFGPPNLTIKIAILVLTVGLGILMVTNLKYYSFKEIDFKGKVPFIGILLVVLVFVGVAIDPPEVLFSVFFLYSLSGPVLWLWRYRRVLSKKTKQNKQHQVKKDVE